MPMQGGLSIPATSPATSGKLERGSPRWIQSAPHRAPTCNVRFDRGDHFLGDRTFDHHRAYLAASFFGRNKRGADAALTSARRLDGSVGYLLWIDRLRRRSPLSQRWSWGGCSRAFGFATRGGLSHIRRRLRRASLRGAA